MIVAILSGYFRPASSPGPQPAVASDQVAERDASGQAPALPVASRSASPTAPDAFAVARRHSTSTLEIRSRVDGGEWVTRDALAPRKGQTVELGVERHAGAEIRWLQIVPDTSKMYKNANFPWETDAYKWVGFGRIEYHTAELKHFRGDWTIKPFDSKRSFVLEAIPPGSAREAAPTPTQSRYYHRDVGSFWFQAEVLKDGRVYRSPGVEESDQRGLSTRVFRVSIRDGEGYLGYVTSFYNVPGVFGSVTYQSSNYIGVDCADVLVAARARWKDRELDRNYNVAMVVTEWPKVTEFDIANGKPARRVGWNTDVRPGDLIAVRYEGRRQYQHIGALYGDADADGELDEVDLVIHAGPWPLHSSRLSEGNFDGHVVILRP
jgi:hypothetical protein